MQKDEAGAVIDRALAPLLEAAGFTREGAAWTSRLGEIVRRVELDSFDSRWAVIRAEITVVSALEVLRSAPPGLDLTFDTVPASQLLQLWITHGMTKGDQDELVSVLDWRYDKLTPQKLEASVVETFRSCIGPFFQSTSTVEQAWMEVWQEGEYGDCGPMSYFQPRVNHSVGIALFLALGERWRAMELIDGKKARRGAAELPVAFKEWALSYGR